MSCNPVDWFFFSFWTDGTRYCSTVQLERVIFGCRASTAGDWLWSRHVHRTTNGDYKYMREASLDIQTEHDSQVAQECFTITLHSIPFLVTPVYSDYSDGASIWVDQIKRVVNDSRPRWRYVIRKFQPEARLQFCFFPVVQKSLAK